MFQKIKAKLSGMVHLKPHKESKGDVLISYVLFPFLYPEEKFKGHTNRWECREMARIFQERGFAVDIIEWSNATFVPRKKYAYFIDIANNMERLAPVLNADCVKIFHITGSHWLFQNQAEYKRLLDLKERRGIALLPRRTAPPSHSLEHADIVTMLGNDATESTYRYANKKIIRIPVSTTDTYESPEKKDFESARKRFVWVGGGGMVHKGLDITLEAFKNMPEYHLSVCGPVSSEKDFESAYFKELYETSNIKTFGKIDLGGPVFKNIADASAALIHPSCSEGQSGAVVTAMHAGLMPLISKESGVDIAGFGENFAENTVEGIRSMVQKISSLSADNMKLRAMAAWNYANAHHTQAAFSKAYRNFIDTIAPIK